MDTGRYVRVRKLGEGGFGEVWLAQDPQLNRPVALKQLKNLDAEDLARFRREAQTAAQLSHPNIAAVYEATDTCIVMQYIDGRSLEQLKPETRDAVRFVRDAARAVHFAHSRGFVHRDLKPANIMVDSAGHVYVMDFGLARPRSGNAAVTAAGIIIGTPAYMSPEQSRAEPPATPFDIYSLGATLYDLVAGRPPFDAPTIVGLLVAIESADPAPPCDDRDLRAIILSCLEKEPERRYPSAEALADDLDRWLRGEPVRARPPSVAARGLRFAKRHRVALVAGAAILVALLVVGGGAVVRSRRAGLAIETAEQLEKEGRMGEARDAWRTVVDLDARSDRGQAGLARTDAALQSAARHVEIATSALESATRCLYSTEQPVAELLHRAEQARAAAESALASDPGAVAAWYLAGRAWEMEGRPEKGAEALRAALVRDPQHGPAHFHLARMLLEEAIVLTFDSLWDPEGAHTKAGALAAEAGRHLDAAAGRSGFIEGAARDTSEAMRAYARREYVAVRKIAEEALARTRNVEGTEELHLLRGLTSSGVERLAAYNRALAIRPRFAPALFCRAHHKETAQDLTGALADYDDVIALRPLMPWARINRASVRSEAGDFEGAIADCDAVLKVDARNAMALANRAVAHMKAGRLREAIADADAVVTLVPRMATAWSQRSLMRMAGGDLAGALADASRAIELGPSPRGYHIRATVRIRLGDLDAAIADYDGAVVLAPDDSSMLLSRADLKKRQRRYADAEKDAKAALVADSRNGLAHAMLAMLRVEAGDLDAALRFADRAVEFEGKSAKVLAMRASIRFRQGDYDGAIADAAEAVALDAACVDAWSIRGKARAGKGDVRGAFDDYAQALKLDSSNVQVRMNRAALRRKQGDIKGTMEDYGEVLRLMPTHVEAWVERAEVHRLTGNTAAAIADCDRALAIDGRTLGARVVRGLARASTGDHRGAIADLDEAIAIDPAFVSSWGARATSRLALGEIDAALADCEQVVKRAPQSQDAYVVRANVRGAKGDLKGQTADLERALSLAPTDWPMRAEVEKALRRLRK